jgi:NAD(P)H dehydrogenase (quinone)
MRRALSCALPAAALLAGVPAAAGCPQDARPRVLVAYHSESGSTREMADAVAAGAREQPGACVDVVAIGDGAAADPAGADAGHALLLAADAIVVGSPVRNGNPAAAVLAWIEGWPFAGRPLAGKVGAAFATGGGISAGEEATLEALLRPMLMFGMVVVGGDSWQAAFGASAITGEAPFTGPPVAAPFIGKARGLGRRVASIAARLAAAPPTASATAPGPDPARLPVAP